MRTSSTVPARRSSTSATVIATAGCAATSPITRVSSTTCNARFAETDSEYSRMRISQYMNERPCPDCGGARLKRESLMVRVGERNINQLSELSIKEAERFFRELTLDRRDTVIAGRILKEINARLKFLIDVGLDYLTINRAAASLAGGGRRSASAWPPRSARA